MAESDLFHTVSNFHAIEALDSAGISEAQIAELNYIVQRLLADTKTANSIDFINKLQQHIEQSPNAHNLDISQYGPDLVLQLYQSYRDSGYTGSIKDMLIAIEKDVEVGSHLDMVNGWSPTKAVNTVEWRWRYHKHLDDPEAHKTLLDTFRPQYCLNLNPILSLDYRYLCPELQDTTEFPLEYWNDSDGTINTEICFNYMENIDSDIFTLIDNEHTFHLHLNITDTVTTISCYFDENTPLCTITYDKYIPPAFINRISITYNQKRIAVRDMLKTFNIIRPAGTFHPHTLTIGLPIRKSLNSLRTLAVYRQGISISEQNFFLN